MDFFQNMVISKLNEIQESGAPSPKHLDIERNKNEEGETISN
jgi:hypothetical protein